MILLWGRTDDPPLQLLRRELLLRDQLFVHVDDEEAATMRFEIGPTPASGCIRMDHTLINLADISACYLRPDARYAHVTDPEEIKHRQHFQYALCAWADVTSALVLNRPAAMWSNQSKAYQTRAALEVGFAVPPTLITTEPEAIRDFLRRHGRVIYKSISSVRSIVSELKADDPRIDEVTDAPLQVQAYVEGVDHRVHMVGDQVFACRIDSGAADYRYDRSTSISAVELPLDVEERCIRLARLLGLTLTGIDLRLTPQGEWVCFEANPSPGYSYYQQHTGLPIAEALAELLGRGVEERAGRGDGIALNEQRAA